MYPGCETCRIVLDRLLDATTRLDHTILRMRSLIGAKRPDEFEAVLREAESLRMESRTIRAELERHRAEHRALPPRATHI